MPTNNWRLSDFGMGRASSNRDRLLMKFDLSRDNSTDVHEACREVQTKLHVPQQRLSASEQHCAVFAGKPVRFIKGTRTVVDKVTHARLQVVGCALPWRQRQSPRRCCDSRCTDRCCL